MSRIDFHVHLAPRLAADETAGAPLAMDALGQLVIDGHAIGPRALYAPDELVTHLDACGLSKAVVSPPPPFFRQGGSPEDTAAWARALNDGTLAAVGDRERLLPLAYLPLDRPHVAEAEYARIRHDDRFAGVCGAAGGASASLADPALAPLWRALDEDERLLLLHPGSSPDPRLAPFYLHNLVGNPVETAVAVAQLVFGDVLSSHPRMRVLVVHCGGCVPDLVPRWDRGVATERPGIGALAEPPSRAVRRLYADCLVHDPGAVDRAVEVFGDDRLVLGSDWPFPMGTDDPVALVAHRGPTFVEQVAATNAAAALGRR